MDLKEELTLEERCRLRIMPILFINRLQDQWAQKYTIMKLMCLELAIHIGELGYAGGLELATLENIEPEEELLVRLAEEVIYSQLLEDFRM
mmetsp:Transcript_17776/g.12721  ORF Transcript_17776/g.12721 Transcript_17776/m.12721 type:complete len:91 (+) Transcript_17776:111-383(+)